MCVCVYGDDFTKTVPGFKPSEKVALGFNGDIGQKLDLWKSKIEHTTAGSDLRKLTQSIAKKIVRTGFSLVMPRSKSWTTDLQISFETFATYYPEKEKEMREALEWSKFGSANGQAAIQYIDVFGKWLAEEFQRTIPSDSN